MKRTNTAPYLLVICLLLAACGGRTYWPDGGRDAGPDAPDSKPPDRGPDAPDSKAPDALDSKVPDAADAKVTDAGDAKVPDAADAKVTDLPGPDLLPGTWVTVKAGAFDMGSPKMEKCRAAGPGFLETLHRVTLTNKFMIMNTEVTQKEFKQIMLYDNSDVIVGDAYPAHRVTWHQAAAYCDGLTKRINDVRGKKGLKLLTRCYTDKVKGSTSCNTSPECTKPYGKVATCVSRGKLGKVCMDLLSNAPGAGIYACDGFRLPTEAEWEYAYRAGSQTPLYESKSSNGVIKECNLTDNNAGHIGWYSKNSVQLSKVKQKEPNLWKLYDMAGNAAEWSHDGYTDDLGAAAITDPVTPVNFTKTLFQLVVRGGSYKGTPANLRGAARALYNHTAKVENVGFRCVRTMK